MKHDNKDNEDNEWQQARTVIAFLDGVTPEILWGVTKEAGSDPPKWMIFGACLKDCHDVALGTLPANRFECVWENSLTDAEWKAYFQLGSSSSALSDAGTTSLRALVDQARTERDE